MQCSGLPWSFLSGCGLSPCTSLPTVLVAASSLVPSALKMVNVSGQGHSAATPSLLQSPRTRLQITNQTQLHQVFALVQLPPLGNEMGKLEVEITGRKRKKSFSGTVLPLE